VLGALFVSVVWPLRTGQPLLDLAAGVGALFVLALLIGFVESSMARLKLLRVPQLLVVACVFAVFSVGLALR